MLKRVREVKNHKGLVSVNVIRPAVFVGRQLLKLRLYHPTKPGRQRSYFLMITLQRNGFQVLEKDASELYKIHSHNCKPFPVNLRKGDLDLSSAVG